MNDPFGVSPPTCVGNENMKKTKKKHFPVSYFNFIKHLR